MVGTISCPQHLQNDRKNQRSQGWKKCRRSYFLKSIHKECRYIFFFYIDYDDYGFYVEPGIGNRNHTHHSPLNQHSQEKSKSGIDNDDENFINDMADGQAKDAQIQNIVFNKTGKLIPRYTIRQITKYKKRTIVNESDFREMFHNQEKDELSPTEYMMRYCRARNYNFQLLLNDPYFSSDPTSETYTMDKEEPITECILDFNEKEMDKLKNNVNFGRIAMDLKHEQKYMMSFAWVNPKELYLLDAFPEVIMVDTTEKTNNEKRPLLTAGGKDSNGNMFIFLRVFMPNQQSWMFRWIFSVVFPRLIPRHILQKIRIVITDGDPQEFSQIDNAIQTVIQNAKRIRCGWHIVHQGFERHVDTTFPDIPTNVINQHKKILLNWIYSWMKRRCLTYLQYRYSRYLFMKYLYSKEITDTFGIAFSNNVSTFVRQHVLTHENYFLFCHRKDIRHYGEYANTPLEGTNFGIKHSSIGTHPGLSMDNSMVILSVQSDKHLVKTNGKVMKANKKHCVNYKLKVHNKLTVMASSMLSNLIEYSSRYKCIRIGITEWLVRKKEPGENVRKMYIPDFDVIQKVTCVETQDNETKQLKCSCQYADVYGLPCIHSIVVAESFKPKWKNITHNDVSVRWWKAYYLFSLPESIIPDKAKQQRIKQVFRTLRQNEVVGIHVKPSMYHSQIIHEGILPDEFMEEPHVVQCMNYPDSNQVSDFDPFNSNLDGTMSQITDINTQLSDNDDDEEDDVFAFVAENIRKGIENDKKTKSYYSQLKPNFTEAVHWITCQEEVDDFAKIIDSFVSTIKRKKHTSIQDTSSQTYISSNLPIETARKHHGCDGWKNKKRKM